MATQTVAKAPLWESFNQDSQLLLMDVVHGKAAKLGFRAQPILSINANSV